jgi:hypothetical protein
MSNVIEFPTMQARNHSEMDRALDRFHAAGDGSRDGPAAIEAIMQLAFSARTPEVRARARRWLAEVLNVKVLDAPLELVAGQVVAAGD